MKPELDETLAAPVTPQEAKTATVSSRPDVPPTSGLAHGQQLGHFRIERRIGAGGMGEVYLATDLALDRPVAVKVLPDDLTRDPKRRDRLVREARAQARVSHPNVGHMYFIGEEAGRLFFAMEYVNGKTLTDVIAQGPMSVDDALSVIRAAALGLREAQREGFTHRDVKPSNLMLDGHGMVKVLDFGLAAGEAGAAFDGPVAQTSLAGTPLYMAPEQARCEAVDHRCDIYALGATLFHLISGKPPFQADSVEELITLHASSARPAVPRRGIPRTQIGAVDALIQRMMAANPDERFATYDELLHAIEIASAATTRPGGFWARSIAMAIDATLVTAVLALVFTLFEGISGWAVHEEVIQLLALIAYFTIAISRWGRTIGKAIFELEVVDVKTQQRPTRRKALRRALDMFAVATVIAIVEMVVHYFDRDLRDVFPIVMILTVIAGVIALVWASNRVAGKRALWDKAAHTLVRYRTTRTAAK